MRLWIVVYDVADDARRRRLAQRLETRLTRVQESVFEGWLSGAEIHELRDELARLIVPEADRVRAYPLACRDEGRRRTIGVHPLTPELKPHWIV